jgi:hypothetical protein
MQVTGRIIAVQESRFRLATQQGQVYLLTLAPTAPLDAAALQRLQQQRAQVSVEFEGEPNLLGGVALDVLEGGA